jgi:hypothetical protein
LHVVPLSVRHVLCSAPVQLRLPSSWRSPRFVHRESFLYAMRNDSYLSSRNLSFLPWHSLACPLPLRLPNDVSVMAILAVYGESTDELNPASLHPLRTNSIVIPDLPKALIDVTFFVQASRFPPAVGSRLPAWQRSAET